jgi:lantibiotic protection ABC transporter MutE/EpiE family permease subunit
MLLKKLGEKGYNMLNYLKSENLKMKRTFGKKLIFILPLALLALTLSLGAMYFQVNSLNWWYTTLLPGLIALYSAMVNQKENKKLSYRAVLSLPVDMQKVWISKIILILLSISVASAFVVLGVFVGGLFLPKLIDYTTSQILLAFVAMVVTTMWKIPLCLFIAKRFGFMLTLLFNVVLSIFGTITAVESLWWLYPYAWTPRIMTTIVKILPNGLLAEPSNSMIDTSTVPTVLLSSLIIFTLVTFITTRWFKGQEVK